MAEIKMKIEDRSRFLFCYGTLMSSHGPNAKLLDSVLIGKATIKGDLYTAGWYPAVDIEGEGVVHGEVYEINDSSVWRQLDMYEGVSTRSPKASLFVPVGAVATLEDGKELEVTVYSYNQSFEDLHLIASGDFDNI